MSTAKSKTRPSLLQPGLKAHLITSPGFLIDFFYWVGVNFLIYKVISNTPEYRRHFDILYDEALVKLMGFAEKIAGWSNAVDQLQDYNAGWWLIGLLASSCCAFQLILNLFSVGCAGFNTYLGPLRPFFLALAACMQLWMWNSIERPELQMRSAYFSLTITVCMSFMPEMVYFWTTRKRGESNMENKPEGELLRFKVDTMACVACVNTITNGLVAMEGVVGVQANLDAGTVEVTVGSLGTAKCKVEDLVPKISETLEDLGFPADLVKDSPTNTNRKEDIAADSASFLQAFVAGSLASSCCLVQLALNLLSAFDVLHIGCAGFNKVLGPLRPYTRAFVVGWLGVLWSKWFMSSRDHCCEEEKSGKNGKNNSKNNSNKSTKPVRRRLPSRLLSSTLVSLSLMILPEILLLAKNSSRSTLIQTSKKYIPETILQFLPYLPDLASLAIAPAYDPATTEKRIVVVDNMGCEACESGVERIMNSHAGVISGKILDFDTGEAEIILNREYFGDSAGNANANGDGVSAGDTQHKSNDDDVNIIPQTLHEFEGVPISTKISDLHELDAKLRVAGYELRPKGWETKKMKLDRDMGDMGGGKSKKSGFGGWK